MYRFLFVLGATAISLFLPISKTIEAQEKSIWFTPILQCWVHSEEETTNLKSASDNVMTIVVPLTNGTIEALDAKVGKAIWSRKFPGEISSDLIIDGKSLYLTAQESKDLATNQLKQDKASRIYSIDIDSGINNWSKSFRDNTPDIKIDIVLSQTALFIGTTDGKITKLNRSDGALQWEISLETSLSSSPVLSGEHLLVNTENKTVVVISEKNGQIVNQVVSGILPTSLEIINSGILIGDERGFVRKLSLPSGSHRWQTRTGGRIRQMTLFKTNVIVISDDNFAYLIADGNGKKLWKRKLSGRILGGVILDQQIAVFLSTGSTEAIFVDLNNGRIVNRILSEHSDYYVSSPISAGDTVILPTNTGLEAYSPNCGKKTSGSNP